VFRNRFKKVKIAENLIFKMKLIDKVFHFPASNFEVVEKDCSSKFFALCESPHKNSTKAPRFVSSLVDGDFKPNITSFNDSITPERNNTVQMGVRFQFIAVWHFKDTFEILFYFSVSCCIHRGKKVCGCCC